MKINKICILALLLVVSIFIMATPVFATATTSDDIEWSLKYNGDCGKSSYSVTWQYHTHNQTLSDKYYNNRFTLSAGGGADSGVMENYVYKNYGFYSQYASKGTRKWDSIFPNVYMINVEEGVKIIGDHAFNFGIYYNGISSNLIPTPESTSSNVRHLSLPSTLEEIGFCGFAGALKYVETLTLPSSVSSLDYGAFCANGFSTVIIEEGNLSTIPSYCFANCTSIEEIYIPKTVTTIDSSAFMGCTSLKKIYYGGYEEDWEKVTISGDNDALLSAQISFPIKVHVSSVTLNVINKTLMAGNTYTLTATVLPTNADITDVVWSSSNSNIATVSENGVVTAVSAGTATITATTVDGNISATCRISVQNVAVESISLNKSNTTIHIGKNETLTATVSPTNATNKNISWNSSNPSVATVSSGIITARTSGTAVITATADGGKSYSCTVIVTDHNFAGIWENNSTYHWHECIIDGCEITDTKIAHQYDNNCDTTCDCGYVRTVSHSYTKLEKNTTEHWYSCSLCGTEQPNSRIEHSGGSSNCQVKANCATCEESYGTLGDHNYDTSKYGYQDTAGHAHKCLYCEAHDTLISHSPNISAATEDTAKYCTVNGCGYIVQQKLDHIHQESSAWEYDSIYHWHDCIANDGQEYSKDSHTFDNACDTTCNGGCGYVRIITHNYTKIEKSVSEHWYVCTICNAEKPNSRTYHSGGTATCTEKAKCEICNADYGSVATHTHGTEFKNDATNHWNECACGDKANVAPHADTNNDEKCDACSYAISKAPSNNETEKPTEKPTDATDKPTDATESEKDDSTETDAPVEKGYGGCGSSAALSAVALVGVIGTALVIKKKED